MLKKLVLKFLTSFGTPRAEVIDVLVSAIKVRPMPRLEAEKLIPIWRAYNESKEHELPPITLMSIDGGYYLFDGQHRLAVRAHNGHHTIACEVIVRTEDHNLHLYTEDVDHLLELL